jgi:hypothetical protein
MAGPDKWKFVAKALRSRTYSHRLLIPLFGLRLRSPSYGDVFARPESVLSDRSATVSQNASVEWLGWLSGLKVHKEKRESRIGGNRLNERAKGGRQA